MNNFGVIEVASAKTTNAPGWAYVPDTGKSSVPSQSVSAVHLHVSRSKRAARQSNAATGSSAQQQNDISARHDSKLQKEIEQLQRDSLSNVQIPIPSGGRDKDGKIRGHTPNVRKILASQKTFANHLDDFEAWVRTGEGAAAVGGSTNQSSAAGTPAPPASAAGASRRAASGSAAHKKGGASSSSKARSGGSKKKAPTPAPVADADVTMEDAPPVDEAQDGATPAETESKVLRPFAASTVPTHPEDNNPLLESWLPPLPTDQELRELIKAPPLNFNQARGTWGDDQTRYPPRSFCEVCGYWGRVRCMKCGTKVCALDCLDVHREDCITRYGL
ncbi:unnamed protein product [Discula destructiva]